MASIRMWAEKCLKLCGELRVRENDERGGGGGGEAFSTLCAMKTTCKSLLTTCGPKDGELLALLSQLRQEINHLQLMVVRGSQQEDVNRTLGGREERRSENDVVLIVLGCKDRASQRRRVKAAHELAITLRGGGQQRLTVVFSGGGSWITSTEAADMRQQWTTELEQLDALILIEEGDSMDTVGNAVFSWVKLNQQGIREPFSLYCVTDKYHAPRTMLIFSKVFGPHSLCVIGVTSGADRGKLGKSTLGVSFEAMMAGDVELSRAVHEIKAESLTTKVRQKQEMVGGWYFLFSKKNWISHRPFLNCQLLVPPFKLRTVMPSPYCISCLQDISFTRTGTT